MKKLQIALYTMLIVISIGMVIFFGIQFYNTYLLRENNIARINEIDKIPEAEVKVDAIWQKEITYEEVDEETIIDEDIFAEFRYENLHFISYSEQWDEAKLELLYEELLKNVHGYELDYVGKVIVQPQKLKRMAGYQQYVQNTIEIPVRLDGTLPKGFRVEMANKVSDIVLYNGDEDNTIESMARVLSHEYGHHFTLFHFHIEEELIKQSQYYDLRYNDNSKIRISGDDFEEYMDNHLWYLIEIAANDYVYLMGSPNTRVIETYYDAKDSLKIKLKGTKDADKIISTIKDSFNLEPHENIAIPLPDRVDGLPEYFYGVIGKTPPPYENNYDLASSIKLKISKVSELGHDSYKILWNKPFKDKDVIYTLAAYNENDKLLGGIKSINGKESSFALIGETVITNADNTSISWWNGRWITYDFLRFRVIVTFPDGSASVSAPLDKEF